MANPSFQESSAFSPDRQRAATIPSAGAHGGGSMTTDLAFGAKFPTYLAAANLRDIEQQPRR
jgi:hypothetical protein